MQGHQSVYHYYYYYYYYYQLLLLLLLIRAIHGLFCYDMFHIKCTFITSIVASYWFLHVLFGYVIVR